MRYSRSLSFLLATAACGFSFLPTLADTQSVPVVSSNQGGYSIKKPDWSHISFSSLPPIQQSGWIKIPDSIASKIGYSQLQWKTGESPSHFLTLGGLSDAFSLQSFSLAKISKVNGTPESNLSLKDLGLMKWQTTRSLSNAVSNLGSKPVNNVTPLKDLASAHGVEVTDDETIDDLIDEDPDFADASMGELDLSQYSLNSIPELDSTSLERFSNWQASFVDQVPGLERVDFSDFPTPPPTAISALAIADVVWSNKEFGTSEVSSNYFISGSDRVGFNIACPANKPCSYLELSDFLGPVGPLHGRRWVSGESQQVKGGYGILGSVNGGKEPTGRLVFGSGFKVVMTGANESTGTADFGLYFRFCHHGWIDLGCTPYFIGPVPWIPVKEKDLVIVKTH